MWRVLVFLLVLSQGAFANPAIEDLKAGFEEALNKVKVLQAAILEKHIEIQQKQADLEATIQTVENLKLRLDDLEATMQTVDQLVTRLEKLTQALEKSTALTKAYADTKANQAEKAANKAQSTANDARTRAINAQSTANNAMARNKMMGWCDCETMSAGSEEHSRDWLCPKDKFIVGLYTHAYNSWCTGCIGNFTCCRPCKLSK
jgi:hypothetical protein